MVGSVESDAHVHITRAALQGGTAAFALGG
jgi:hypothetical protein